MFSKKVNYVALIAFLVTAIFSATSINASEQREKDVIRVGYNVRQDLVENINNRGNEGYGYEILKKIEEQSELRFEFVKVEGNMFHALKNGTVDIAGLYYDTPERREDFAYMQTPLNAISSGLMVRKEDEFPFANPEDIHGKTVATYEGNLANDYLDEFLLENNISVDYKFGEFDKYLEQDADLFLMYSSNASIERYTTVLNLAKRNAYIISDFGNEDILSRINEALLYIIINEGDYFEELAQKYYSGHFSALHRNLTKEELEVLRSRPLTVAYETNHQPFTYLDAAGQPAGAIIDVINTLVEIYNFEVVYQPYTISDPSTYPKHSDIIASEIGNKEYYETYYTNTESYHSIQMIAMVPDTISKANHSSEEIRKISPKIGVINYLNANFTLFMEYAVENEFLFFNTFYELLDAYEKGIIDMAVFTQSGTTYANSFLKENNHYTYATDFFLDFHLGIENSIAEKYIPLLNVMLDNISSKEYEEIIISNTSTYFYEETFVDLIVSNSPFFVFIIVSILLIGVIVAYMQQEKKKAAITAAYNTDIVTGFPAAHKFVSLVSETLSNASPNEYEIVSMDVDMFRTINTHYSSGKGTAVIKAIADALKKSFDKDTDFVTRRTAEQFLVLRKLGKGLSLQEIYNTKVLPAVRQVLGETYNFSMSFGSVVIEDTNTKVSTLIGEADAAKIKGKGKHKTTFVEFTDKMKKQYENKVNITFLMENAMKEREFFVVYQPQIRFDTLLIDGAEALVRWKTKSGEIIFPDAFIPVFEDNGFIATLDLYVFEEVCKFITENESKMNIPTISVNLSAKTMLEDTIVSKIYDIVSTYRLDPKKIELEITESAMVADESEIFSKLRQLKEHGFGISIDDFGAGVSSLNRLSALEAGELKLDKDFLKNKEQSPRDAVVIQNIITLAKNLNMKIVAEGVETNMQAKWLQKINCDYAQGYYFERPLDQEVFKDLLTSKKAYSLADKSE